LKKCEGVITALEIGALHAVMLRVCGTRSKAEPGRDLGCMKIQGLSGQHGKTIFGLSHCERPPHHPHLCFTW